MSLQKTEQEKTEGLKPVNTGAENGVTKPVAEQYQGCQQLSEARAESWNRISLRDSRGTKTADFGLLASRTERSLVAVVLRHKFSGNLSQVCQETNIPSNGFLLPKPQNSNSLFWFTRPFMTLLLISAFITHHSPTSNFLLPVYSSISGLPNLAHLQTFG